jgi:hypothetical protein
MLAQGSGKIINIACDSAGIHAHRQHAGAARRPRAL